MEDLTRTQIVLLCVLVSFVTSIGTGIITVSLLQEAPPGVTQTISRVVERTVERVVPQTPTDGPIREVTVVVKEEDLVIDAINKNQRSLVRIAKKVSQGAPEVVGLGLVISNTGNIITDSRIFSEDESYVAIFSDERQWPVKITSSNKPTNTTYLETLKDSSAYDFHTPVTTNSDSIQLGQTVIAIGGKNKNQVNIGRIASVNLAEPENPATLPANPTKSVISIQTDTFINDDVSGAMLLNLSGELVGIEMWRPDVSEEDFFVPINIIKVNGAQFFDPPQNNNP